jgi:hypothetical protein
MLGDGSYGAGGNSDKAETLGVVLFTRERAHEKRSEWGGQAAAIADMQHNDAEAFKEVMRFRSKGETPPARVKGRQSYQRLRRRLSDREPIFPEKLPGDDGLCDLPDIELDEILEMAEAAVGVAQANEAYAQVVAANVREIVVLEHLHDHRMSLAAHTAFHPMRIVREQDLRAS